MNAASVVVSRDGHVGRITLAEPDRLNAVSAQMLDAIAAAATELDSDPAVRVIVLAGEGRAFCAGADLTAYEKVGDLDPILYALGRACRAILGCGTPVLALVPGVAAGAGLSLALAADYTLVGDDAKLLLAFGALGLMPDGGSTALVAASIGRARALRFALTGERISGLMAADWGLVAESVAAEGFSTRADELTEQLAALAPEGVALTTGAITASTVDVDATIEREESGQYHLSRTDDFVEGISAFREKRPPSFGA